MKFDLSQKLLNLDKSPLVDEHGKVITLGKAIANCLIQPRQGRAIDATKCYILATRFYESAKEVEIDQSDLDAIKEELKSGPYGPIVAGQATIMLTHAPQSLKPSKK